MKITDYSLATSNKKVKKRNVPCAFLCACKQTSNRLVSRNTDCWDASIYSISITTFKIQNCSVFKKKKKNQSKVLHVKALYFHQKQFQIW